MWFWQRYRGAFWVLFSLRNEGPSFPWKDFVGLGVMRLNTKMFQIWKFQRLEKKEKKKKKKRISRNFSAPALTCQQTTGEPSLLHAKSASELRAYRAGSVCVCRCVCLSHTLYVIYSLSDTLPFCLLVNCHSEGGYNGWLRGTINLDTSYLCLPLQGEACPVANVINPLPLCAQPPAHTVRCPSSLPQRAACRGGKKQGPLSHLRGEEHCNSPYLPYIGPKQNDSGIKN